MQELREIAERIRKLTNWNSVPTYVIRQVGALTRGSAIEFMDMSVSDHDGNIDGVLVAFTRTNVTRINWQSDSFVRLADARISSTTWSRRQLQYVRLENEKNSAQVWEEDWDDQWPRGAILDLVYQNSEGMSLPLAADKPAMYTNPPQHRADILTFFTELLKDLQ